MNSTQFKQLEDAIVATCRRSIAAFAASTDNKQVYAYVLEYDVVNDSSIASWNTISRYKERVARDYQDATADSLSGAFGLKYSSGDFDFHEDFSNSKIESLLRVFGKHLDKFESDQREPQLERLRHVFVRAIGRLRPNLARLDQTRDFVAFVSDWQRPFGEWISLMRMTIPPKTFDRLFPDSSRFERNVARIVSLSDARQARLWIHELHEHMWDRPTKLSALGEKLGQNVFDMAEARLSALGRTAVPVTMRALGDCILNHAFSAKKLPPAGRLALMLFDAIAKQPHRDYGDERLVNQALSWLQILHKRAIGNEFFRENLIFAAIMLNTMAEDKYPAPRRGGSKNPLQNWRAYGLDKEKK